MLSQSEEDRRVSIGPRADSRAQPMSKKVVAAAVCTACVVGAVAYAANQDTSAAAKSTNLLSVPESFSGTFSRKEDDGSYHAEGSFSKVMDDDGEWRVDAMIKEYRGETTNTYTVVDRIAIRDVHNTTNGELITRTCQDTQTVPAYGKLKATIDGAAVWNLSETKEDANEKVKDCSESDDKLILSFAGNNFAVCASRRGDEYLGMKVFGPTFTMDVRADAVTVPEVFVLPEGSEDLQCNHHDPLENAFEMSMKNLETEGARSLSVEADAWPYKEDRSLLTNRADCHFNGPCDPDDSYGDTYCVFLHGVGNWGHSIYENKQWTYGTDKSDYTKGWGYTNTRFKEYWGQVDKKANCINTRFFNVNSKTRGWDHSAFTQEVCTAMAEQGTNLLFTHSMGGLTSAQAFVQRKCVRPRRYHMSQPPLAGSKAAMLVVEICAGRGDNAHLWWPVNWGGYCNGGWGPNFPGTAYNGYHSLHMPGTKYHYPHHSASSSYGKMHGKLKPKMYEVDPISDMGQNSLRYKADSKLCGTSPDGLGENYFTSKVLTEIDERAIMQKKSFHNGCWDMTWSWRGKYKKYYTCNLPWNDGMVDYDSCRAGLDGGTYQMPVNHQDGTCHNGDSSSISNAKPCKWYTDRTTSARNAFFTANTPPPTSPPVRRQWGTWG